MPQIDTSVFGVIKVALYGAIAYVGLPVQPFFVLAILLALDFITGVLKSYVLGLGIRSYKASIGMISKMVLILIPVVLALLMKGTGFEEYQAIVITSINVLILSEAYSTIANIYTITTREEIEEFDAVSAFIRVVLDSIKGVAERINPYR